jgi:excisionase family DNA binding protein
MITPDTSSELLTVAEAAQALRISKPTIWRWIREGRLHPVRLGRRVVRLRRSEVVGMPRHKGDGAAEWKDVLQRLNTLNERILARRGGVPFESSVPLIHEARSGRDEQL